MKRLLLQLSVVLLCLAASCRSAISSGSCGAAGNCLQPFFRGTHKLTPAFSSKLSSSSTASSGSRSYASHQPPASTSRPRLTKSVLAGITATLNSFLAAQNLAGVIRLAFHDCVGGCDGCVNLAQPVNRGLEKTIAALDGVYRRHSYAAVLSRADFWAYAGHLGVKLAVANSNAQCFAADCHATDPDVIFRFGRRDCASSPSTTRQDPIPLSAPQDDTAFFAREFGFSVEETVAIMGSHNLAAARAENSGHVGTFVPGQANRLNNNYYKLMLRNDWQQVDAAGGNRTASPSWQWNRPGLPGSAGFMLNTDIGLWKDIQVDSTGKAACEFRACGLSHPAEFVVKFANSNDDFVRVFVAAFDKMQARGSALLIEAV
jgi:hypothetical protein